MGLSIAISGGITALVLVVILGIIFAISYQINTESLATTDSFEIQYSFQKTNLDIKQITAVSGGDTVNFLLYNNGSTKLWKYDEFDFIVTYDADILGTETRITEQFTFNETASFSQVSSNPFSRPDGIAQGGWGQQSGCTPGTAYLCIDETIQDDSDFIRTSLLGTDTDDVVNFTLSTIPDPQTDTGHVVRYTYREEAQGSNSPDLEVGLFQGDTQIAAWTESGPLPITFTLSTRALAIGEAASITDYSDLRIGFNGTCDSSCLGGGNRERVSVSWAELETPATILGISGLQPREWGISNLVNDVLDPRILNFQEGAEIRAILSYPIFASGELEITISTDNGKANTDSIIVT